jgi:hypothetical protein
MLAGAQKAFSGIKSAPLSQTHGAEHSLDDEAGRQEVHSD